MYICRFCNSECQVPGYCQKCTDDYKKAVADGDRPNEISADHFNYFVWQEITSIKRRVTNGEISAEEANRQISDRAAVLQAYYEKLDQEMDQIRARRRLYSDISNRQLRDRK